MDDRVQYRQANPEDTPFLAHCVRIVSGGVVDALLGDLFPNISAEQIVAMMLRDDSSQWSHKNCILVEADPSARQSPIGLLFAYPDQFQEIPPLMRTMIPKSRIAELEDVLTAVVPSSLYINTFWVEERFRGSGLADSLLDCAVSWATDVGLSSLSLFALRDNARARAFYEKHGFHVVREVLMPESLKTEHGGGDLYQRLLPQSTAS